MAEKILPNRIEDEPEATPLAPEESETADQAFQQKSKAIRLNFHRLVVNISPELRDQIEGLDVCQLTL